MIYIVRHGQTDWNLEGRYQGRIDIELNETGIEQAQIIRDELKNIKFDKIFSSPLKRAHKTAEIICNDNIIIDERLIERCNGKLEGTLKSEVKEINFNENQKTELGIEPIEDFRTRIDSFFKEILEKYEEENILVVTHAGISIYARCFFEGEPIDGDYSKYKLKNCEILKYKNKKTVKKSKTK